MSVSRAKTAVLCCFLSCAYISCDDTRAMPRADAAIDDDASLIWVDLVTGEAWTLTADDSDPFIDQVAERRRCSVTDYGEEYGGVEISTYCGYMTLEQAITEDLQAGDVIEFILCFITCPRAHRHSIGRFAVVVTAAHGAK